MTSAQFLNVWEFIEIAQAKVIEKELRRFVKQRSARNFGASRNFYQAALHQGLQNAVDGDATNRFDVCARDRLPISDNGQRLERGRS